MDVNIKTSYNGNYLGITPHHFPLAHMRSEGYGSCVCACVCLSVKLHLRPEIDVTYSMGNEGQKMCEVFFETASLRRSSTPSIVWPYVQVAIFHARAVYL